MIPSSPSPQSIVQLCLQFSSLTFRKGSFKEGKDPLARTGASSDVDRADPKSLSEAVIARYLVDNTSVPPGRANEGFYFESLRKWSNLSLLCSGVDVCAFSSLSDSEKNDLLPGGDAFCFAAVIYHLRDVLLSQHSRSESSSDFLANGLYSRSRRLSLISPTSCSFVSLMINKDKLRNSKEMRYIQTAHTMADVYERVKKNFVTHHAFPLTNIYQSGSEYIPSRILARHGLREVGRVPMGIEEIGSESGAGQRINYSVDNIILHLNEILAQNQDKFFRLGIKCKTLISPPDEEPSRFYEQSHSLALALREPFHFFDPKFGIGYAETEDDLFLYLAAYLKTKYVSYQTFALSAIEAY